jgi:hypothetical protein
MDGLLRDLPAGSPARPRCYGHRREVDCSDIEQIVPVGNNRAAIRTAVNGLSSTHTPSPARLRNSPPRSRLL